MARIRPVNPDFTPVAVAPCFLSLQRQYGSVPNFFRELAVSPPALHGYMACREALDGGALTAALRLQVGLGVAAAEGCDYQIAALRSQADSIPLSSEECERALRFESRDPKRAVGLRLARAVLQQAGGPTDEQIEEAREAGYSDPALVELVSEVSLAQLASRVNRLAQTAPDLEPAPASARRAAAASEDHGAGFGGHFTPTAAAH